MLYPVYVAPSVFLHDVIYMGHPRGAEIIIEMKNAASRKLSCTQPRASHEIMKGVAPRLFPRAEFRVPPASPTTAQFRASAAKLEGEMRTRVCIYIYITA